MKFYFFSIALILGFLVWLLIDVTSQVDMAPTKNNHYISWQKFEIDSLNDINRVKLIAKSNLNLIEKNREQNSITAIRRIWIIIAIIVLQTLLLMYLKKNKRIY